MWADYFGNKKAVDIPIKMLIKVVLNCVVQTFKNFNFSSDYWHWFISKWIRQCRVYRLCYADVAGYTDFEYAATSN